MKTRRVVHDGWRLTLVSGPAPDEVRSTVVPATVPGVVHTDLLTAGLVADPLLGEAAAEVAWVSRCVWRYATSFTWSPDGANRHDLVLEGLDTLATVRLNGSVVATTANQHRSYRVDVRHVLRPGTNQLEVTFDSALDAAEGLDQAEHRPHVFTHPFNALRKAACNFGWDWGPDLVTAGIWRPVALESWSSARLASVRPLVTHADESRAVVDVHVALERMHDDDGPLKLEVRLGGVLVDADVLPGARAAVVRVELTDPELWWPVGYGQPALHRTTVVLRRIGGEALDEWTGAVGLRTVEVDRAADDDGEAFGLVVNGQPVFVRGLNWIPDDVFVTRVDAERYATRIGQALGCGANLLRVWGGGVYEAEDFYRLCDESGLLVWQDFAFACATYDEERLWGEVEAEAREVVTRLSAHPSVVVWNGGNENVWQYNDLGWREQLGERSWGRGFFEELLPSVLAELDPTRPYVPSSPFSPTPGRHPNDPNDGLTHVWDVWNDVDWRRYGELSPRFVSEFGFQAPPTWGTLRRALADDELHPGSSGLRAHQKADGGDQKLRDGWRTHFPDPVGMDDWMWTTQLNQVRAITFAVERYRALSPRCRGTILWQLNDCWPAVSWSAVDGDGRPKPLWFALRRAYADRLLTIQDPAGEATVAVVNDHGEAWTGALRVERLTGTGEVRATWSIEVDVPARSTARLLVPAEVARAQDAGAEVLHAELRSSGGTARTVALFVEDRASTLPRASFNAVARRVGDEVVVEVTAHTLVRDLTLLPDRLELGATVSDQVVTLLPGEHAHLTIHGISPDADLSALLTFPALRTADDLLEAARLTASARDVAGLVSDEDVASR